MMSLRSTLSPSGKPLGFPAFGRLMSNLTRFFFILHTCIATSAAAAKTLGKMGPLSSGSSLLRDFGPTSKSVQILFLYFPQ